MLFRTIIAISLAVICLAGISFAGEGCDLKKGCCDSEPANVAAEESGIYIPFIYNVCNDLSEVHHFYSDLLGWEAKMYSEEWGFICYQSRGLEFMFFRADAELPQANKFACQPGWEGGTLEVTSWSILFPEDQFRDVYERLKSADAKMYKDKPEWRCGSYWGLSVLDPMGNTVEVCTYPKEKPENTEWVEQ